MRLEPPKRKQQTEEDMVYYKKMGKEAGFGVSCFCLTVPFGVR